MTTNARLRSSRSDRWAWVGGRLAKRITREILIGTGVVLVIAATAWAAVIGKSYSEDCDDFTYEIKGGSFDSDDSHCLAEGTDWVHGGTITENAATFGDDELTVTGSSLHDCRPHGELDRGPIFRYSFFGDAGEYTRGVRSYLPKHSMIKRHNQHFDAYLAQVSILVDSAGSPDIIDWDFEMTGKHTKDRPTICGSQILGLHEVPPTDSLASGIGDLIVDPTLGGFTLGIVVSGIAVDQLVGAHIHLAPPGENGPVILDLGPADMWRDMNNREGMARSILDGQFPIEHLGVLLSGDTYINIHTMEFPSGEIRGQLEPLLPCEGVEISRATYRAPDIVKFKGRNFVPALPNVEVRLFDARGALEQSVVTGADDRGVVKATFRGVNCMNKVHRVETDCDGVDVKRAQNCL